MLVVDSNIVFTIVIAGKRALAYRIVKEHDELELYSHEEILVEFREHSKKLRRSAREEFWDKVLLAFSLIRIVPRELYDEELTRAYSVAKMFDSKDTSFIALSLKLNYPIWTEDKDLLRASFKTGMFVALDTESVGKVLAGEPIESVREQLYRKLLE